MKRILLALALVGAVAEPAHAQKSENGMPDLAFLFEARFAFATTVATTGLFGGTGQLFAVVPALLIGARLLDRIHVGLGFSFWRLSVVSLNNHDDDNVITFAPTIAADIFKASDNRVAFYGKLAIPLGPVVHCTTGTPCDDNFGVGVDIAFGVRYAAHRNFAIGVEAGFAGAAIGPQRDNTVSEWNFYGGLVGSFFSGR
jgi:hypothetical protein